MTERARDYVAKAWAALPTDERALREKKIADFFAAACTDDDCDCDAD